MEKVDITIIGAGVAGLAIASVLSKQNKEIIVLERHDSFGQEASSRNSEVIHAGIYYPQDSLKAKLCVQGNRQLYELCEKHAIACEKIGKLVIANNIKEIEKINHLYDCAKENSVTQCSLLTRDQIREIEPSVKADAALFSGTTGIIDTHQLMKWYETSAEQNGVIIAYNCAVRAIEKNGHYLVHARDTDGQDITIQSEIVINAAGLQADTIASMAGIDIQKEKYKIYPCKGEYFTLSSRHKHLLKHLVYPAPTPVSLGIHTVIDLNHSLKLGPNAFYVNSTDDYDVDSTHQKEFFESAKTYLPFIEYDDLSPAMSGIRAKLQSPDELFRDFIIREESDKGLPGFINLLGIESPGLTSSYAIAEYVEKMI